MRSASQHFHNLFYLVPNIQLSFTMPLTMKFRWFAHTLLSFTRTRHRRFVIFAVKCCSAWYGRDWNAKVRRLTGFRLTVIKRYLLPGCQQNYHKRCVVKVPNNCSRVDVAKVRSNSTHLQTPRSPSGGSNHSGSEDQQSLLSGSGTSLVRKMQQLMNDIKNWRTICETLKIESQFSITLARIVVSLSWWWDLW